MGGPAITRARAFLAALIVAALAVPASGAADHHGEVQGHLPASTRNMELVGKLQLTQIDRSIGDVTALGNHAYLSDYWPSCQGTDANGPGGGVFIVDLTVPQLPLLKGYISAGPNDYVGEGVHALHLETKSFRGDVLMFSTEPCGGGAYNGGIQLWDVTDPASPKLLSRGIGDRAGPGNGKAHSSHSAQMWTTGRNAYAVVVDNHESGYGDVDIVDITNPRKPKLIAETGLAYWPDANRRNDHTRGTFGSSNHHDMWVKKVGGHWLMLVSYWDTGWVILNVDNPARPRFVRDYDYARRDAITGLPSEGNAHQGTWTGDNRWIIGTDEDFFAKYTVTVMGSGGRFNYIPSAEVPWARTIRSAFGGRLLAKTVYGGLGCALLSVPPASQLKAPPGMVPAVVLSEGACSVAEKLEAAQQAGYRAAVIAASHQTSHFGDDPNRFECTPQADGFSASISAVCIGHETFHRMFRSEPSYIEPFLGEPQVGTRGRDLVTQTYFDGSWGFVRMLDARSLKEIDAFAIPESLKERYAEGFGALTVHEVKVDPRPTVPLAYVSWYAGGARVLRYSSKGIKEVGHFIDTDGNNFWGTFPLKQPNGPPLLLFSDMDYGLYVLRYTGAA